MNFGISEKIRVRSSSKQKLKKRQSSQQRKIKHKKQIQKTLSELYQLQSQLSKLNVPQNPHSSSPSIKQIKNLSLLYENMTKPKIKNTLNIQLSDIQSTIKIINSGETQQETSNKEGKLKISKNNQISLFGDKKKVDQYDQYERNMATTDEISSDTMKKLIKEIYNMEVDLSIITEEKSQRKNMQITTNEIYKFLNFNQFDNFDPIKEAYNCLLDKDGKFSFERYNKINELIGLPAIEDLQKIYEALELNSEEEITFQKFKLVIQNGKNLYLNE